MSDEGKSKDKTFKVVMLGDTPVTPQVLLSQLQGKVDNIEAFVTVMFHKSSDGERTVQTVWTKMPQHDLAYASVVLDINVRKIIDMSKDNGENEEL